jgi:hypothetical protein
MAGIPGRTAPFQPVQQPQAPPAPAVQPPAAARDEQIEITEEVQLAVLWDHAKKQIVDRVTHDETGDVVAAALEQMFPSIAVHMRGMTADTLTMMIQSDPTLSQLKDDPRLPEFIKQFLGYFQQVETEPQS